MNTKTLGDQHLGRDFTRNVPLHRRGDLTKYQWEVFTDGLDPMGADLHINLGDVFDKAEVSFETIMGAYNAYMLTAMNNPKTTFIIIMGNHDKGRDLQKVTAFDIFTKMVSGIKNITIVDGNVRIGDKMFFAWHPTISADQLIKDADLKGVNEVYGHWDVDLRSPPHNLIPTAALAEKGVKVAYTGHVHAAEVLERDGVDIQVVGSMMGFAHGEGHPFVTMSTKELEEVDKKDLKNLCVRIRLDPDEVVEEIPDVMHFTVLKESSEPELVEVEIGEFDLQSLFDKSFEDKDISEGVKKEVDKRWLETFTKQDLNS